MGLSGIFEISGQSPVSRGTARAIYQHPVYDGYLIKVFFGAAETAWYRFNRRRYGRASAFLKEMREQLLAWKECGQHPPYLQKIIGLCETDLGPGMVVEKVSEGDRPIGRNLLELIFQNDFDEAKRVHLEATLRDLEKSPLYFNDLKPRNLVFGSTPGHAERFVLVDGFGHKEAVPVKRLVPALHERQKRQQIASCREKISRVMVEAATQKARVAAR